MERLKEGIGLRGYSQEDPMRQYAREGFELFTDMYHQIEKDISKQTAALVKDSRKYNNGRVMSMLGFFKRDKDKIAKEGDDHTVDSMELLGEEAETTGKEVKTKLYFPSTCKYWTRGKVLLSIFE